MQFMRITPIHRFAAVGTRGSVLASRLAPSSKQRCRRLWSFSMSSIAPRALTRLTILRESAMKALAGRVGLAPVAALVASPQGRYESRKIHTAEFETQQNAN